MTSRPRSDPNLGDVNVLKSRSISPMFFCLFEVILNFKYHGKSTSNHHLEYCFCHFFQQPWKLMETTDLIC